MNYTEMNNDDCYLDMSFHLTVRTRSCDKSEESVKMDYNDGRAYRRGDIYLVSSNPHGGTGHSGVRPMVVLQNNAGNLFNSTLIVAPITCRYDKRRELPTHYYVGEVDGIDKHCVVLLEQIMTIDKRQVKEYSGSMTRRQMKGIDSMLEITLGLRIPEDVEAP